MTRVVQGQNASVIVHLTFMRSIYEMDPAAIKLIITSFDAELESLRPNSLPIWSYPCDS